MINIFERGYIIFRTHDKIYNYIIDIRIDIEVLCTDQAIFV